MQPKMIFWDWNGTLIDDVDLTLGCLNSLLAEHGYPQRFDLKEYREVFGFPIEQYYAKVGFDFARHPYPMLAEKFMQKYNAGVADCPAVSEAKAVLGELARRGWQQTILSACRRDYLFEQVTDRGLKGYFTELLGLSDIYGVSKVELGLDWLRRTGEDASACVMVGDTDHDAEVARALGAKCVLCTAAGHQSRARLEAVCPNVIDSLTELPDVLEKL